MSGANRKRLPLASVFPRRSRVASKLRSDLLARSSPSSSRQRLWAHEGKRRRVTMRKLIGVLFLFGSGALAVLAFPDIKRYLKMRAM